MSVDNPIPARITNPDAEPGSNVPIDIVKAVFHSLDRNQFDDPPSFIAAQNSFDSARAVLRGMKTPSSNPTELAEMLIADGLIPGTVSIWDESQRANDRLLDWFPQILVVAQLFDLGIMGNEHIELLQTMHSAMSEDRSNALLLEFLNKQRAIASVERVENEDPNLPAVLDHILPTSFEGVVAHLGISEDKADLRGKRNLDLAYFKIDISPHVYGKRFAEETQGN